jgi:hypothetical protein
LTLTIYIRIILILFLELLSQNLNCEQNSDKTINDWLASSKLSNDGTGATGSLMNAIGVSNANSSGNNTSTTTATSITINHMDPSNGNMLACHMDSSSSTSSEPSSSSDNSKSSQLYLTTNTPPQATTAATTITSTITTNSNCKPTMKNGTIINNSNNTNNDLITNCSSLLNDDTIEYENENYSNCNMNKIGNSDIIEGDDDSMNGLHLNGDSSLDTYGRSNEFKLISLGGGINSNALGQLNKLLISSPLMQTQKNNLADAKNTRISSNQLDNNQNDTESILNKFKENLNLACRSANNTTSNNTAINNLNAKPILNPTLSLAKTIQLPPMMMIRSQNFTTNGNFNAKISTSMSTATVSTPIMNNESVNICAQRAQELLEQPDGLMSKRYLNNKKPNEFSSCSSTSPRKLPPAPAITSSGANLANKSQFNSYTLNRNYENEKEYYENNYNNLTSNYNTISTTPIGNISNISNINNLNGKLNNMNINNNNNCSSNNNTNNNENNINNNNNNLNVENDLGQLLKDSNFRLSDLFNELSPSLIVNNQSTNTLSNSSNPGSASISLLSGNNLNNNNNNNNNNSSSNNTNTSSYFGHSNFLSKVSSATTSSNELTSSINNNFSNFFKQLPTFSSSAIQSKQQLTSNPNTLTRTVNGLNNNFGTIKSYTLNGTTPDSSISLGKFPNPFSFKSSTSNSHTKSEAYANFSKAQANHHTTNEASNNN